MTMPMPVSYTHLDVYKRQFLNSTLTKKEIKEVHDDLQAGKTKMLYVAPELSLIHI